MTLHLKSRGYPFRPRLLFSSFIVVGVGFPTVYYFRRGQSQTSWGNCRESLRLFVISEYFKIGISRFPLQESSAKGM